MADQETIPIGLETQNKVADVYDEGYEAAGKDAQGGNEGEEPR